VPALVVQVGAGKTAAERVTWSMMPVEPVTEQFETRYYEKKL
jgi:hypothetical protein